MTPLIGRVLCDQVPRRHEGLIVRRPGQIDQTVEQVLVHRRKGLSFRHPPATEAVSARHIDIGEGPTSPKL
jgi:hypothetical protein